MKMLHSTVSACALALVLAFAPAPLTAQESAPPTPPPGAAQKPAKQNEGEKTKKEAPLPRVGESEIIVTAPRMEVPLAENPAATTVVGEETLATMPRSVAADEALKLVPGVKVDNQADGERVHLSVRGQGILSERGIRGIKVLLDGIPLNDPTGFVPDLFDVDWSTVDRIEVLRGPASALYGGGGSGGIISIHTRDGGPEPVGGRADFVAGSHGFWKTMVEAGGTRDGVNYTVSASRTMGDGYRVHTAFAGTNVLGKVRLVDGPRTQITAIVIGTSFFNDNAEGLNIEQVHQDPKQPNPDALTFNEFQRTRRGTAGVVGHVALTENQDLGFTLYYRHTQWKESVPSSVQHRDYDTPGASLQYTWTAPIGTLTNHLTVGTDLEWQTINDYRRPNLGRAREGAEVLSDEDIDQHGYGFWALDRLELDPNWTLVLGARRDSIRNELDDLLQTGGMDLSGKASFDKTTGRIGVAWQVSEPFGAYASWGQGFMPPATEELANNPAHLGGFNGGLQPATSHGEEVGVRGTIEEQLGYDVAVFRLDTANDFGRYRITTRPLETFYQNAGDSTRYGVETLVSWMPVTHLSLNLAYTYSHFIYDRVEFNNATFHDTWLPNSPEHQIFFDAAYDLGAGLEVGLSAEAYSRAYIDPTNTVWIGGYTLYDARLAYKFSGLGVGGQLLVSARNFTGKHYIAFTEPDPDGNSYQPGPTQEYFAGLRLTF
jgi:iron complex outermembrane receptor protein